MAEKVRVVYDASPLGSGYFPEGRTGIFTASHELLQALCLQKSCQIFLAAPVDLHMTLQFLQENPFEGVVSYPPRTTSQEIGIHLDKVLQYMETEGHYKKTRWLLKFLSRHTERALNKKGCSLQGLDPHILKYADIYHSVRGPLPVQTKKMRRILHINDFIPLKTPHLASPRFASLFMASLASLQKGDTIVTPTEYVRQEAIRLLKMPSKDVHTIPYGISSSFSPRKGNETFIRERFGLGNAPYFLAAGRQDPRKNFPRLVEAFIQFSRNNPDKEVRLVLVGPANDDTLVMERFLPEAPIIVTGFITQEELAALYREALAFVHPSLAEGFGLPPLEAMKSGTPVISSAESCLPEVLGPNAYYIKAAERPESIYEALQTIFDNADLREELSRKGLAHAANYSWENCAKQTCNLYESLCK